MLHRRLVVNALLEQRPPQLLAVSSLGSATWDLTAAGDDARNFCFIGAMGQAAPFALGLAMAQPAKRVVLLSGDGELLMSLGVLATIANRAPSNLAIVVLDNESYAETGGQPTATAGPTDLEAVARGCGISNTCTITEQNEISELCNNVHNATGPFFADVKIVVEPLPLALPHTFDGATAINRFRSAVLDEDVG
jgi:thiamine pyrophosphate-dependent acetolactate synthase large subunit-like protein